MNYFLLVIRAVSPNVHKNIFGMSEDVAQILIPTITTILVFIVGQIIIWFRNQNKKYNEVKNYQNVILSWIDLIQTPVMQQVQLCRDFAVRMASSSSIQPERFSVKKMLANKLNTISVERYIYTFMINTKNPKGENDKMIFNLISQVDFLASIESDIVKKYKEYHNQILELMNEWNSTFNLLKKTVDDWSKPPITEFRQPVIDFCRKSLESNPPQQDTLSIMNNLIIPLEKLVSQNSYNEDSFQLKPIFNQLEIIVYKWDVNKKGNSQNFNDIAKSIESSYRILHKAKEYFAIENKRCKIFWFFRKIVL